MYTHIFHTYFLLSTFSLHINHVFPNEFLESNFLSVVIWLDKHNRRADPAQYCHYILALK